METVGKIRRRHFVKGESISRIARETGLSRNTVKRYLRNAVLEPHYSPRLHQVLPKLGTFIARLEALLEEDEQRPSRERRTAQRLFEALRREGYAGAYDSVRRFVKGWPRVESAGWLPGCSSRCISLRARLTSSTGATRWWRSGACRRW